MSDLRLLAFVLSGGFSVPRRDLAWRRVRSCSVAAWLGRSAGSCCSGVYFPDPLAGTS